MTPAARAAAAIGVLDAVLAGAPAEEALLRWSRGARYAGSGDRAAVRDLVFDGLRGLRSLSWSAGAPEPSGRAAILGKIVAQGIDPASIFSGEGHAPAALSAAELAAIGGLRAAPEAVAMDLPDWLLDPMRAALGDRLAQVMAAARDRARVYLRVNRLKSDLPRAVEALAADGIVAEPEGDALRISQNASKIKMSSAYLEGLVELQDRSSQEAVAALGGLSGARVLDYCAGGGGKSLALAALGARVTAHDAQPARMRDLPARAVRAGAKIALARTDALAGRTFDMVLVDAPCSGSGTWRRTPDAKWRLTSGRLADLVALQSRILDEAAPHVGPGGRLGYMTCSVLVDEDEPQIAAFLARHPDFRLDRQTRYPADPAATGGDGFFSALLSRVGP
jgi:16S rRNA (cytosine967-C5)-methyltransferase